MPNKSFMVKVVPVGDVRSVIEVPSTTMAKAVDSLHYHETKQVSYIQHTMEAPISTFGPFAFVELETGFEDEPGKKSVVYVKPSQDYQTNH